MLGGQRILIVEDEPPIAIDLESVVRDLGGVVVGIASTVGEAIELVDAGKIDGAILDLLLRSESGEPVADALVERRIPFVIHSGTVDSTGRKTWSGMPSVTKPAPPERVVGMLANLLQAKNR